MFVILIFRKMRSGVKSILQTFEPISLAEMDGVKLMDRTDLKFIFHARQLPELLAAIKSDYRVLEIAGNRMSRYETLYYDTPEYELFRQHHNGKTNRYKIRLRKYVESDLHFFEVKFKNNKGRTKKTRVKAKGDSITFDKKAEELLATHSTFHPQHLEPKLWVNYSRITLVNRHTEERVTIDLDLEVKDETENHQFEGLIIVEAKQARPTETAFVKLLRNSHIREGGMSKYCMAVAQLKTTIKKNNFKEGLLTIDKICSNGSTAA